MKYAGIESKIPELIKTLEKQIDMLTKRYEIEQFSNAVLYYNDGKGNKIEWFVNHFSKDKNNVTFMHITEHTDDMFKAKTLSLHIDKKSDQSLEEAIKQNFEWKK